MKQTKKQKQRKAQLRAHRVRARLFGTAQKPRLSVKRSLKHIFVQLIDDAQKRTLVSASDLELSKKTGKMEMAKEVGKLVAERAKARGISLTVFDRGSYRYHGRVAALADGAREGGLIF